VIDLLQDQDSDPRKCRQLIAELPTGYGKTLVICLAYAYLKSLGEVGRLLIIVPSGEQLNSYVNEIEQDMRDIGVEVTGALSANSLLAYKAHQKNKAEIFIVTIQALTNGAGPIVNDLLSTGRWLVGADEFHRYAENNTWGKAISCLSSVFTLAVSATPERTDKADKAIHGKPDVTVSLKEAVEEGAIRPVIVRSSDYAVDITMKGSDEPQRFTTKELTQALAATGVDISSQEVKMELRYFSKYLHTALLDAWGKLQELNMEQDAQHKMLVFAMGVGHAKAVCDQMNAIAGSKVADWIGVQSTVPLEDGTSKSIGKNEKENDKVLEQFKDGAINVLVQVRKATEGFNDVKCSVLLFLNLTGESVQLKQMIGRGLRRNYAVEQNTGKRARKDKCWIFVSTDHPGLEYMKRLEDDLVDPSDPDLVGRAASTDPTDVPVLYRIPEFFLLDATFAGAELFYPFGDETISEAEAVTKARSIPALATASDADIQAQLKELFGMTPKPKSATQTIKDSKDKVTKATRVLAQNVVRVRTSRAGSETFPSSLQGDTCRAINSRWRFHHPSLSHDNMTKEEFEEKYNWIKGINDAMKEAPDPLVYLVGEQAWLLL